MKTKNSILAKENRDKKSFPNFAKLREEEPKNESPYKELVIEEGKKIITYNDLLKETRLIDDEGKETVIIDPITVHEKEDFDELYNKNEMYKEMAEEFNSIQEHDETEINWNDEINTIRENKEQSHDNDEPER